MIRFPTRDMRLSHAESQWHDALRLLLILQVVLGHTAAIALPSIPQLATDIVGNWPYVGYRLLWRFGPQAAFLFVFLSGFMVAGPLLKNMQSASVPSGREFFSKRLRRIVPIAVSAVLFTALLDWLSRMAPNAENLYRHSYAYDMVASANWTNFVGNLLFLQPVFVHAYGSNGPLWTLGYIVQYYVLGWTFCKFYSRSRALGLVALAVVLVGMTMLRPEWSLLFVSWLVGGVARNVRSPRPLRIPFLVLGGGVFIASNLVTPLAAAALSIPIGFFVAQALMHAPVVERQATNSWLRRLSNDTYVIYAVHHAVLMSVFIVLFGGTVGSTPQFFLYAVIALAAVLVASVGVTRLVNTLMLRHSLSPERQGAA